MVSTVTMLQGGERNLGEVKDDIGQNTTGSLTGCSYGVHETCCSINTVDGFTDSSKANSGTGAGIFSMRPKKKP